MAYFIYVVLKYSMSILLKDEIELGGMFSGSTITIINALPTGIRVKVSGDPNSTKIMSLATNVEGSISSGGVGGSMQKVFKRDSPSQQFDVKGFSSTPLSIDDPLVYISVAYNFKGELKQPWIARQIKAGSTCIFYYLCESDDGNIMSSRNITKNSSSDLRDMILIKAKASGNFE